MGYTAPPTPGTNRAVGSGYAKLTPSRRPPPRFPTKARTVRVPVGQQRQRLVDHGRSEAKYLSGRMQPLAASNRRFSTGLSETRLTGHPLDARLVLATAVLHQRPRPAGGIDSGRMPLTGNYEPSPAQWVRDQVKLYESSGGTEG